MTGKVQGLQATGQPIDVPVTIGGSDAGTKRALAVDASGRVLTAGGAASGATAAGNPTLIAGTSSDGNVRTIRTDTTGRLDKTPSTILASGSALVASSNVVAATAGRRLSRVCLSEDAGAVATFFVRHGTTDAAPIVHRVYLQANEWTVVDFDELDVANGVRIQRVAGSCTYSVHGKTV